MNIRVYNLLDLRQMNIALSFFYVDK